jgi:uncharacterized iron-regulated protein
MAAVAKRTTRDAVTNTDRARLRSMWAIAAAAALLVLGSTVGAATTTDDQPLPGRIWDVRQHRFVTATELLTKIAPTDFILLGEVHDNPEHHAHQAEVLSALIRAGRRPALVMEQFDRENQPAIDVALAAGADAEAVAVAGRMDRKGWQWAGYEPLVRIAVGARLPVVAANLSRGGARDVAVHGFDRLDVAPGTLALPDVWTTAREDALAATIVEGHCGQLRPQDAGPMTRAQRARDAIMADSLVRLRKDGAVLIAGGGHVRRDIAVPLYLRARAPGASVVSIAFTEVQADTSDAAAYETAAAADSGNLVFDYLWFSPRAEREDPCAGFKLPPLPR